MKTILLAGMAVLVLTSTAPLGAFAAGAGASDRKRTASAHRGAGTARTAHARAPSDTYFDPDGGLLCHNSGGWAICEPPQGTIHYFDPRKGLPCTRTGFPSICSNIQ